MSRRGELTRERIVAGAADLLRRRGLAGSTIRDLAAHSGAPLGSTYHYFPGGKQQLAADAVRYEGAKVSAALERELESGTFAGVRAFLDLWREILIESDFEAGCTVVAVAVEAPPPEGDGEASEAAAEVFGDWRRLLAASLRDEGVEAEKAAQLATLIIAAVEGTVAMCRAARDINPLDDTAAQLELLIANA